MRRPQASPRTPAAGTRILRGLVVLGALSAATACGTLPSSGSAQAPSAAPAASAPTATRATCEALGQAYQVNMAPMAEALTTLVGDRKTVGAAQKALATFANAVEDATATSQDPDLKAAGQKAATQMKAKSTDATFFATIKTAKDVDKTLSATLTEWLSPVTSRCS